MTKTRICLTIAGLDPSGGAGIIADIKTFSAFKCFAAAAVSSITFQNTTGVFGAAHQTAETIRRQIEPILQDYEIDAVKTGMLPTREVIEETARLIKENGLKNLVVDPVARSTSGCDLIDDNAIRILIELLFPLSDVVTPNIPEAERIAKMTIRSEADIKKAAGIMQSMGARNVLIKGGHLGNVECGMRNADLMPGGDATVKERSDSIPRRNAAVMESVTSKRKATDYLFKGTDLHIFEGDFLETTSTHGTGCTLSAAIAANLALGKNLKDAVEISKRFVFEAIKTSPNIGHGHSPVNHFAVGKNTGD